MFAYGRIPMFLNALMQVPCDQCDAYYVGFTTRRLHQRIQEHRYSAIGKHLINIHGGIDTSSLSSHFDCLLYEMLIIKELKPSLNTQADSIRANLLLDCVFRVNR